jgi:hypothetical protein
VTEGAAIGAEAGDLLAAKRDAVVAALERWLEEVSYASCDPYDGLTSPLLQPARRVPLLARAWMQVVKRSPLDLRPLLGIRPAVYTKSLSDLAQAYARRAETARSAGSATTADAAMVKARGFLALLRERRLPAPGSAWGMDLPYVSRFVTARPTTPNLYQTVNAAAAFLDVRDAESWRGTPAADDLDVALGATEFMEKGLGRLEASPDRIAWRYYPGEEACVYNVNALAGALLLRLGQVANRSDLVDLGRRTLRFVVEAQNPDGSWWYARGPRGRWVDGFHTGFILDALAEAVYRAGERPFAPALERGIRFYTERMFTTEHLPRYDARSDYPVEVQNCAQAIQTLSILAQHNRSLVPRARATTMAVIEALFRWTRRAEPRAGYFMLSRGRTFTNRLAAVRWGQAPMLLALEHLAAAESDEQQGPP